LHRPVSEQSSSSACTLSVCFWHCLFTSVSYTGRSSGSVQKSRSSGLLKELRRRWVSRSVHLHPVLYFRFLWKQHRRTEKSERVFPVSSSRSGQRSTWTVQQSCKVL